MTPNLAFNLAFYPAFSQVISRDGWTIPQAAECLKQAVGTAQLDEKTVCCTLLAWVDTTMHVAIHATGRRFTRLQFIENTLSVAGFALTQRDFEGWFKSQAEGDRGDWRPNGLLPYTPIDPRLEQQE